MGRHDIEAIVEWSVASLDEVAAADHLDTRAIYCALYRYQARYDTNYTHFRVMKQLLTARFEYAIPVHEHPDYARCGLRLDTDYKGEIGRFVYRDPCREWDADENPSVGYVHTADLSEGLPVGRYVYFDAGGELWRRFVEAGKLAGPDAEPPKELSLAEVAAEIVRAAEKKGDRELVRMWLAALFWDIGDRDLEELKGDRFVREVRAAAKRVDALSVPSRPELEWGCMALPGPEDSWTPKSAAWWFDLDGDPSLPSVERKMPVLLFGAPLMVDLRLAGTLAVVLALLAAGLVVLRRRRTG
ncbi:hypothetical protein [Polyangium mundeleinium]|uniref:Uncharacterized protein n=1 Tax=Polyangium mundeleinium TaxID=2995306 RepID=A0ABT5FA56_9BACT|nr:hypothetical protein [Polyangium mundeleinium]MDC0750057.1 hypothetical protein [Polyangium mundeleinium]